VARSSATGFLPGKTGVENVRTRLHVAEHCWYIRRKAKQKCKIWGLYLMENTVSVSCAKGYDCCVRFEVFYGGDYEECRLLWYKNPVHTSQETHYVSATDPSRLMLCKIWGIHGGDYEECRLLWYKTQFVPYRKHITSLLQSPAG
jgi:hypothetical protein